MSGQLRITVFAVIAALRFLAPKTKAAASNEAIGEAVEVLPTTIRPYDWSEWQAKTKPFMVGLLYAAMVVNNVGSALLDSLLSADVSLTEEIVQSVLTTLFIDERCISEGLNLLKTLPFLFGERFCALRGEFMILFSDDDKKRRLTRRPSEEEFCKLFKDLIVLLDNLFVKDSEFIALVRLIDPKRGWLPDDLVYKIAEALDGIEDIAVHSCYIALVRLTNPRSHAYSEVYTNSVRFSIKTIPTILRRDAGGVGGSSSAGGSSGSSGAGGACNTCVPAYKRAKYYAPISYLPVSDRINAFANSRSDDSKVKGSMSALAKMQQRDSTAFDRILRSDSHMSGYELIGAIASRHKHLVDMQKSGVCPPGLHNALCVSRKAVFSVMPKCHNCC